MSFTLDVAQLEGLKANKRLERVDNFLLSKDTGDLYALGDPETEGPKQGLTLRKVDQLHLLNKGQIGNQGGQRVQMEYWLSPESKTRIVHDLEAGGKLKLIPGPDN
jgi:hypothetical protein